MSADPQRDAAIDALIPQVPFDGWTQRALRHALASIRQDPEDALLLFPDGPGEMIEAFCALADERMAAAAAEAGLATYRFTGRVRAIIALRLEQHRGSKEAIRRALAWLALPTNFSRSLRITAATVDAIWHAAGDDAADFSWYTKRGILAGIYTATLLYWLRDNAEDDAATLAFLDRRLRDIGRMGGARQRLERRAAELKNRAKGFVPGAR